MEHFGISLCHFHNFTISFAYSVYNWTKFYTFQNTLLKKNNNTTFEARFRDSGVGIVRLTLATPLIMHILCRVFIDIIAIGWISDYYGLSCDIYCYSRFYCVPTATVTAVILWCTAVSSTWQTNFLLPKWMLRIPTEENLSDIPKPVIRLEQSLLYPARLFFQNMFSSQHQLDKSRTLQVRSSGVL